MERALNKLGFRSDPPWMVHKREFEYKLNGFTYVVCLQHIKNFAYLLEVEFLSEKDDTGLHEPNIRRIISELGCEPIEPESFSEKINNYITTNRGKGFRARSKEPRRQEG